MQQPQKKYQIVYADPAWEIKYLKETLAGINDYELPYDTMTDEEIINIAVKDIIADDAILFLWCIDSRIPILQRLMRNWGFEYKTVGFVWYKRSIHTNYENATMSKYTRKSCEFCFIGTRGKYLVKNPTKPQFISEPKREHSRKPDAIRTRIVEMCGDIPRVELFGRQRFEGWDIWGNDAPNETQLLLCKSCPYQENLIHAKRENSYEFSPNPKSEILDFV